MRVLVTGGSGFIGRNLLARLSADGHELSCLDRFGAPFLRYMGVREFTGDMCQGSVVDAAMDGQDAVVHMACSVIPKTSNDNPRFDVESNVGGTINLLDSAVAHGVRRFVFLSSGGTVYGRPRYTPIDESHPTDPECSYGITKLAVEKYLGLYQRSHGLSTCSIRLANPYGEYQRLVAAQGVIPVFCYKALAGKPVEVWGDGSARRDFVYVGDAVDAIARTLDSDVTGPMNVGSGESRSLNEVLGAIEGLLRRPVQRRYLPGRSFDVADNVLDISRAESTIGWRPSVGLVDGLRRTLSYVEGQIQANGTESTNKERQCSN